MTEKKYNNDYVQDILNIINSDHTLKEKRDLLDEYHDKDIAEAFELLPKEERKLFLIILIQRDCHLLSVISKIQKIIFRTLVTRSMQCFLTRWI